MSAKVDQTSVLEPVSTKMLTGSSAGGVKVSKFAAKAGFVIPKNKLSGSLVPLFKGGKNTGGNDAVKEESTIQVRRKTKWAPDVAQDSAVRKAKALAYQTRVEQISEQLKSGSLETEVRQASPATSEHADFGSSSQQSEYKKSELELEKREAIYEILKLDPSYNAPADYKPLLKEGRVSIPIKENPGFNFVSLIFGSGGENLKRLEKETGAKIQLFGTKAITGEKVEISSSNGSEGQVAYEELTVHLSAESYQKVDAAVSVIELLVTSILMSVSIDNFTAGDKADSSDKKDASTSMVPAAANHLSMPLVGATLTPQHGQFQHQNTWFRAATPEAQVHPPNFNPNYLASNDQLHVRSSSLNPSTVPSAFAQRPDSASGFNLFRPENTYLPRNFPMPASQLSSTQTNITSSHHLGSQAQPTGLLPFSRSVSSMHQPVPTVAQGPQPTGWSGAPLGGPTSLGPADMRRNSAMVLQHGFPSSQAPSIMSAVNAVSPANFGSRPPLSNVPGNPPAGPMSSSFMHPQGGPFSAPRPISSSSHNLDILPSANLPMHPVHGAASQFNPQSGVGANFAPMRSNTLTSSKMMHSGPGDFSFHPHHSQNPASQALPRMNNLLGAPTTPLPNSMVPQSPSFRPTMPGSVPQLGMHPFSRPHQRGQPQAPLSAAPFPGHHTSMSVPPRSLLPNPSLVSPSTPGMQMGSRNFSPVPHLPNMAGPFPSRPENSLQLQQPFPSTAPRGNFMPVNHNIGRVSSFSPGGAASHQGGPQIYDPFSPTSISARPQQVNTPGKAREQENDPEYDDLMASVGVK